MCRYTAEEVDYLKSISYMNRKKMAVLFNAKFGKDKTYNAMKRFCLRHELKRDFELDRKPPNRTCFKKGGRPHNEMELGQEYTHPTNGLTMIKTEQGRVFKHHHVWNKPIPIGYQLTFRDGDRTNCNIDNLILVSRAEMLRYNQSYRRYATPENNETLLILGKLKNARHQAKCA